MKKKTYSEKLVTDVKNLLDECSKTVLKFRYTDRVVINISKRQVNENNLEVLLDNMGYDPRGYFVPKENYKTIARLVEDIRNKCKSECAIINTASVKVVDKRTYIEVYVKDSIYGKQTELTPILIEL